MRLNKIRIVLAAAATCAVASAALAYSVQPMVYQLRPSGAGASVRLRIVNSKGSLLNVELQPFAVTADDTGKRTFTPAPDDFLIFPPQSSIAADRTQQFQLRYIGSPTLTEGKVYVVRVHQTNTTPGLAPNPDGGDVQTRLNMVINFNTTAIVQTAEQKPVVKVAQDLVADSQGRQHARIVNTGNGVADLTSMVWSVERGGQLEPLGTDTLSYGDAIFLEPGHAREIVLTPAVKPGGHLSIASGQGQSAR